MELPPFQALVDEHGGDVYRFVASMVGPHDADDCFQETFLSALRAYPRLRNGSNLRSWILTIAHRKAIDALRGRSRRPEPSGSAVEVVGASGGDAADRSVWHAVGALAPKQRGAVFLRHAVGLRYREIAGILGGSEAAARQSVREGLVRLREVLT